MPRRLGQGLFGKVKGTYLKCQLTSHTLHLDQKIRDKIFLWGGGGGQGLSFEYWREKMSGCLHRTMKRLAHFIPHMTNITFWKHIHHKKHVSSLIFQDKSNGSIYRTLQEVHVGPGGQDYQGQGNAHHVVGGVVLRRK
jgi:hypothetical protein